MKTTSNRTKLAIIYGEILHYRIPLFQILSKRYDLTVFTTKFVGTDDSLNFKIIKIAPVHVGAIYFQPGLHRYLIRGNFDSVISFLNVRHLDSLRAVFFPAAKRTYCWGIWLTKSSIANYIRLAAINHSEATLCYCHQHLVQMISKGCNSAKLYVAPNTIHVPCDHHNLSLDKLDSILFVGSLTERKGIQRLMYLFADILNKIPKRIRLILVGDGPLKASLDKMAIDLGIHSRVQIIGAVNDPNLLASYYAKSLVSVSLCQAGLSVLQSMGFGVPFLTIRGSISGGETTNIIDGINGFLVNDNNAEIADALLEIVNKPAYARALGDEARRHYLKYASIMNYAQGFYDMLDGTRLAHVWQGFEGKGESNQLLK